MKIKTKVTAAAAAAVFDKKQSKVGKQSDVTIVVIQQNVRSLKTSDRMEELLQEVDGCKIGHIRRYMEAFKSRDMGVRSHIHGCWKA